MVLDYLNDFWQLACFLFPWLPNQFLQHAPHPPFATFPFQPVCCCRNLNGEVHVVEDDLERTSVNRNCGTNNSAHLVLVTSVILPISCLEGWGVGSPCPSWLGKLPGTPGIYEHVLNWCYYSDCRAISGPKDLAKGRRSKSSGMILNILLVYFVPRILWREGWLAGRLAGGTSYINRFLACQLPLEPLRGGKEGGQMPSPVVVIRPAGSVWQWAVRHCNANDRHIITCKTLMTGLQRLRVWANWKWWL